MCVASEQDNGNWIMSFCTLNKKPLPRNDEDAIKFLEDHKMDDALDFFKKATPITGIYRFSYEI